MTIVFLGGSRRISQLAPVVRTRLDRIIERDLAVVLGDAPGADRAFQHYLHAREYRNVTVFCSGDVCRNNIGGWDRRRVAAGSRSRGFDFFAAKDREMAREADFGLMVWDGRSSGTLMNVLRLLRQGKKVAVYSAPEECFSDLTDYDQWNGFVARHGDGIQASVEARISPEDRLPGETQLAMPVGAP